MDKSEIPSYSRVACIGAGLSGVALGVQLKRWYGVEDIKIFDRKSSAGGTWWINKYPGCSCDIPSALYSFSFEQNSEWTKTLPPNFEMKQYIDGIIAKYGLLDKMSFAMDVIRCIWSDEAQLWTLFLKDLKTGQETRHQSQILFSAHGHFVTPRPCDIPGYQSFRGALFHSARWDQEASLEGKNVVVIGNGCTAAQIVPTIAPKVKHITQIVRTQHWICPGVNLNYGPTLRWIFRNIPFTLLMHRFHIFLQLEIDFLLFHMTWFAAWLRKSRKDRAEKFMRDAAPAKYHDILIPDFDFGCKRRIFDDGYVKSLHRDNLTLTDEKILEIVPEGLKTNQGFVPADVIILATGFKTNEYLHEIEVVGRNNINIKDHWAKYPGPEAYNCSAMSGFPNFFLLLGPNSGTGHTSALMAIENSINYALRVSKGVLEGTARSVEVKQAAEDSYVRTLHEALSTRVWNAGCSSWYIKAGSKWNSMAYPWSQAHYWFRSVFPVWSDWKIEKVQGVRKSKVGVLIKLGLVLVASYAVAASRTHPEATRGLLSKLSSYVQA